MKNNHGGKRKGSGRKPTGRMQKTVMFKPEHWEKLQEIGGKHKVSETLGGILDKEFSKQE